MNAKNPRIRKDDEEECEKCSVISVNRQLREKAAQ